MTAPTKVPYKIYQGATFNEVLRWESYEIGYAPISAISKSAPVDITATAHGIPIGWRVKVRGVQGMKEINSDEYVYVSDATVNNVFIDSINSIQYSTYTSGGVLEYNKPKSLVGYTARMQIREKLASSTTVYELTTENGGIILNDTLKTITLTIPATTTAGFTFKTAVYNLELVNAGTVIRLTQGDLTLVPEVTR